MSDRTFRSYQTLPAQTVLARAWHLPARLLDGTVTAALQWAERSRQRRQLTELSDASLKDLALTRSDVVRESSKWFWRP